MPPNLAYNPAFFILLALVAISCEKSDPVANQQEITVVFRYDDFGAVSDTELEVQLMEALGSRSIACTFAVIPHQTRPMKFRKYSLLREGIEAGWLEVALHGYSHEASSTSDLLSEFTGLAPEEQMDKIVKGRRILENALDVSLVTFVPPYNRYDENTVEILEQLGFESLSAGKRSRLLRLSSNLSILPSTCGLPQLRVAVEAARHTTDPQPIVTAMFHPFDFAESGDSRSVTDVQQFTRLLDWVLAQDDVVVRTIADTSRAIGDLDAQRFAANRPASQVISFFVGRSFVYYSTSHAQNIRFRNLAKALAEYALVLFLSFGVGFLIGRYALRQSRRVWTFSLAGITVALICLSIYVFHDGDFGTKGAFALVILIGVFIGTRLAGVVNSGESDRSFDGK